MGRGYDRLLSYIADGKIDNDFDTFGKCGKCHADECDGCSKVEFMLQLADQVCDEMYQLGKQLTKEWSEVNRAHN